MTAIILAGGKSSRIGTDKAFIKINGIPIIKRQLKQLKKLFKKIIVVTNTPDKYRFKSVKVVSDIVADGGPLGGIYSGLVASKATYNFVLACDMPFINPSLIKFMLDTRDNYDIVIPKVSEKFHTLFGLYSKACLPVMEERLKKSDLRLRSIFPKLRVRLLFKEDIEKFDPYLLSLVNINTPDDLVRLKVMKGIKRCQRQYLQT